MARTRFPDAASRQTNKDCRRLYRLSITGLASLRATALRNRPWLRSTGPRTPAGKTRSRLNATKHGERSAERIAVRREINAALRGLRKYEHQPVGRMEDIGDARMWLARIAEEVSDALLQQVIG